MRAPAASGLWISPKCPFALRHEAGLLEQINQDVTDSFLAFRKGGLETGGLLFGRVVGDEITLAAHRPIACEHAFGPGFVLSESDRARFSQLLREWPHDPDLNGLELVGWYRSSTRGPLSPAPEDLSFHQQFLPQQWQSLLVLKPDLGFPTRAKVFFPSEEGVLDPDAGFGEVELNTVSPRVGRQDESPARTAVPSAFPPAAEPIDDDEESAAATHRKHTPRVWTLFLSVAAGLLALSLWWPPTRKLGLEIVDREGQLHIRWDRGSRGLAEASRGRMEIREPDSRVTAEFDAADLRRGSVHYLRRSGEVQIVFVVETGKSVIEERARFAGPAPARRPPL
ncbi:MAG: hypothetical protein ACKV22_33675 [Bryobacteraceae bacterium]